MRTLGGEKVAYDRFRYCFSLKMSEAEAISMKNVSDDLKRGTGRQDNLLSGIVKMLNIVILLG